MILVLPKEGKQNWAKIPSGEIVTNQLIRTEFASLFEREILAVVEGRQDIATSRCNIGLALEARHFFRTLADKKAQTEWLDKIVRTNVALLQNSRNR